MNGFSLPSTFLLVLLLSRYDLRQRKPSETRIPDEVETTFPSKRPLSLHNFYTIVLTSARGLTPILTF